MRNKILLTLCSISATVVPIAAIVSCGPKQAGKISWNKSENLVQFNLNTNQKEKPFTAYFKMDILDWKDKTAQIVRDFEVAIVKENITYLKNDEIITVEFMFQYEGPNAVKEGLNTPAAPIKKTSVKFKFKYRKLGDAKEAKNILAKKPLGFKTNFAEGLVKGLLATKLFSTTDPHVSHADLAKFFYKPDAGEQSSLTIVSKTDVLKFLEEIKESPDKIPNAILPTA